VGQDVLATREGDPTRVATHAEYELFALHATSIAECDGVTVEKASVAGMVENAYVRGFELVPQLLLLMDLVYDLLCTVQ
jgi:hypothetical protein